MEIRKVNYMSPGAFRFEVVAEVYQTTDYSLFSTYPSNRIPDHWMAIIKNIRERGYVSNPIIVTPKPNGLGMYIIDGNNRFFALKDLKLPISFVVLEDAGEEEMSALNLAGKNWQGKDFIRFYAEQGNEDYKIFEDIIKEYPDFSIKTLEKVLKLSCENDNSSRLQSGYKKLYRGMFRIKNLFTSRQILDFCMSVKKIPTHDVVYNQNYFVITIMRFYRLDYFRPHELLRKIDLCKGRIIRHNTVEGYRSMLEETYNFRSRDKVHLDFI